MTCCGARLHAPQFIWQIGLGDGWPGGAKNEQALNALRGIWNLTMRLVEESTPPALRFLSMLMRAENDEQMDQILQANRPLVTEQMVQALEGMEANMRETGETESAERVAIVLGRVRAKLLQPA